MGHGHSMAIYAFLKGKKPDQKMKEIKLVANNVYKNSGTNPC